MLLATDLRIRGLGFWHWGLEVGGDERDLGAHCPWGLQTLLDLVWDLGYMMAF